MKIVRDSLSILMEGFDTFMYEDRRGIIGKGSQALFGQKKRSMEDFMFFANGISTIAASMQVLSLLSPIPSGISQSFVQFLEGLKKLPDVKIRDKNIEAIETISTSFANLANSIALVNTNLEKFGSLYQGLSIDSEGANLLKLVDNRQNVNVINYGGIKTEPEKVEVEKEKSAKMESSSVAVKQEIIDLEQQKRFYEDISDIRRLLYEIREHQDKPSQAPSFS